MLRRAYTKVSLQVLPSFVCSTWFCHTLLCPAFACPTVHCRTFALLLLSLALLAPLLLSLLLLPHALLPLVATFTRPALLWDLCKNALILDAASLFLAPATFFTVCYYFSMGPVFSLPRAVLRLLPFLVSPAFPGVSRFLGLSCVSSCVSLASLPSYDVFCVSRFLSSPSKVFLLTCSFAIGHAQCRRSVEDGGGL